MAAPTISEPSNPKPPFTVGSATFNPDSLFEPAHLATAETHLQQNNLEVAIKQLFHLPAHDHYVYHANVSLTLSQAQQAVNAGAINGLQDWYRVEDATADNGVAIAHPPPADIAAYIAVFDASKSAGNTLKSLLANAKKDSLRASIAAWLNAHRHLDAGIKVAKRKATQRPPAFVNPYFVFWSWSCHALQWAGPHAATAQALQSHHVLPIFMHHFACVCPSYEAVAIICAVAGARTVLDIGSGAGYWSLMLRRAGCTVVAVDSQQSEYRTCWVGDTVVADGVRYVAQKRTGARGDVLLLVYPIVGGEFTRRVVEAYQGDTICVAGTQNANGYTAFRDMVFDEWMLKERGPDWEKIAQVPLPSFAGKDDALFVFQRRREGVGGP